MCDVKWSITPKYTDDVIQCNTIKRKMQCIFDNFLRHVTVQPGENEYTKCCQELAHIKHFAYSFPRADADVLPDKKSSGSIGFMPHTDT